ncbi:MAG: hypothetical protein ACR2FZ_07440 [Thermoleophilaceae bacterium]
MSWWGPFRTIEESSFGSPWDSIAVALNWGTWLVFLAEAAVMLSLVPDRWRWGRSGCSGSCACSYAEFLSKLTTLIGREVNCARWGKSL